MRKALAPFIVATLGGLSFAAFASQDLSGSYACTGRDSHDGDFKVTMTLALDKKQSRGDHTAYIFKMDDGGHATYSGSVVASGSVAAVTFMNDDASKKDFGTGLAKVTKDKDGAFKFEKFYYEPEYKGGGNGVETCVVKR